LTGSPKLLLLVHKIIDVIPIPLTYIYNQEKEGCPMEYDVEKKDKNSCYTILISIIFRAMYIPRLNAGLQQLRVAFALAQLNPHHNTQQ